MAQLLIIFLHLIVISVASKTSGFSIKMIPIDSLQLQVQHFTPLQKHQLLTKISQSRAYNFATESSRIITPNDDFTMPSMKDKQGYYVTQLLFGSGPGKISAYMLIDTSSDMTWVQCQGCDPCFGLLGENFNYKESSTFKLMSRNDNLCDPTVIWQGSCGFEAHIGPASASGLIGRDNFFFKSSQTGEYIGYDGIAFGCGLHNDGFNFGDSKITDNIISGIHGVAPGPKSFLTQLDDEIKGRFSYCLVPFSAGGSGETTMYFGDAAIIGGDPTRRPQMISMHTEKKYHLYLMSIIVDGVRLQIDPSLFKLDKNSYTKGFFIDSGTPYTVLVQDAYNVVRDAMVNYFANKYGWQPMQPSGLGFDLCYSNSVTGEYKFPSVVLNFGMGERQGEIEWPLADDNMFWKMHDGSNGFCMAVMATNTSSVNLFGAHQQTNFLILYDVKNSNLHFVPQQCNGS